jgi:hypothetical protein
MATLEKRGSLYRVDFRFRGQRVRASLGTSDQRQAISLLARLEEHLRLIELGVLAVPPDAELVPFLITGKAPVATPLPPRTELTLAALFEQYFESLPPGSHEASTLYTMRIHERQLKLVLTDHAAVAKLKGADLQRFINVRARQKTNRGTPLDAETIRKPLVTLGIVWNWAVGQELLAAPYPSEVLEYPKTKGKPRFQTWAEIEQAIAAGGWRHVHAVAAWT